MLRLVSINGSKMRAYTTLSKYGGVTSLYFLVALHVLSEKEREKKRTQLKQGQNREWRRRRRLLNISVGKEKEQTKIETRDQIYKTFVPIMFFSFFFFAVSHQHHKNNQSAAWCCIPTIILGF